jgi:hypothetical protein
MSRLYEPSHVTQQINMPRIAYAISRAGAVAMELPFVDHFTERGGVEQTAEFRWSKFAWISRQSPSPLLTTQRNARG